MAKRTPDWAEDVFALACSEAGANYHRPRRDEGGWDFHVEFPSERLPPPADTHPPRKEAYVQVKSNETGALSYRVKLSNALNAARSPTPWFYVLIVRGAGKRPEKTYAIHVWEQLIRTTLERIRKVENAGHPLNRRELTIRFQPADKQGDNLVQWMHETIRTVGPDYGDQKTKLFATLGYEQGYGDIQIKFEDVSLDQLRRFFLGLGDSIPISRFVYTPSRFGIPVKEPKVDVDSGMLTVTPGPGLKCRLHLRGPAGSAPISLAGQLISTGIPNPPPEMRCARISADFFDLIFVLNGHCTCGMTFDPVKKVDLLSLEHIMTVMDWVNDGPILVDAWIGNRKIASSILEIDKPISEFKWWSLFAKIAHMLGRIAVHAQFTIELSFDDLRKDAKGLQVLLNLREPSLRAEFDPGPNEVQTSSTMIYYFYVDVAEFTFYTLFERPVREDILIDGKRRVTTGPPELVEAYVLEAATEDDREAMRESYERYREARQKVGMPIGLGDVHVLLEAGRNAGTE
jgi:hypothetical protein